MSQLKTVRVAKVDAALALLTETQTALRALMPCPVQLRTARNAVRQATDAVWQAACSQHLETVVERIQDKLAGKEIMDLRG